MNLRGYYIEIGVILTSFKYQHYNQNWKYNYLCNNVYNQKSK